jgi:endogenous inhibitor of DNA gyrase (YacG/DUF329 family)
MKRALCPICRAHPADPAFRPFCSKRCADVDLQRWLTGRYAIPAVEDDEDPGGQLGEDRSGEDR